MLALCFTVTRLSWNAYSAPAQSSAAAISKDNKELGRICAEDQADRNPSKGKSIDWTIVNPRDDLRLKQVKEFYTEDLIQTANDYDCAAIVLQHGHVPDDFLLARVLGSCNQQGQE